VEGDEIGWAYSANGGEKELVYVVRGKVREKEITRKTKA
jgi:hypothetical protein